MEGREGCRERPVCEHPRLRQAGEQCRFLLSRVGTRAEQGALRVGEGDGRGVRDADDSGRLRESRAGKGVVLLARAAASQRAAATAGVPSRPDLPLVRWEKQAAVTGRLRRTRLRHAEQRVRRLDGDGLCVGDGRDHEGRQPRVSGSGDQRAGGRLQRAGRLRVAARAERAGACGVAVQSPLRGLRPGGVGAGERDGEEGVRGGSCGERREGGDAGAGERGSGGRGKRGRGVVRL